MKKHLGIVVALLAGLGLWAAAAPAGDDADPAAKRGMRKRGQGQRVRAGHMARFRRAVEQLDLSREQRAALASAFETHAQALKNWQGENAAKLADLREQMRKAKADKDKEAARAVRDEMRKLMKSRGELGKQFRKQVAEVLTEEQEKQLKQALAGRRGGRPEALGEPPKLQKVATLLRAARRLELTEDQRTQVRTILGELRAAVDRAADRLDRVLTAEQKRKLEQMQRQERGSRRRAGRQRGAADEDEQE